MNSNERGPSDPEEVELEINEDTWTTPFGESIIETRPRSDGGYEMFLSIGGVEKVVDLQTTAPDKARELHERAADLMRRQGIGAEKVAHTTVKFIADSISPETDK